MQVVEPRLEQATEASRKAGRGVMRRPVSAGLRLPAAGRPECRKAKPTPPVVIYGQEVLYAARGHGCP